MKDKIITSALSLEGREAVTKWMSIKGIVSHYFPHYFLQGNAFYSNNPEAITMCPFTLAVTSREARHGR